MTMKTHKRPSSFDLAAVRRQFHALSQKHGEREAAEGVELDAPVEGGLEIFEIGGGLHREVKG